MRKWLFAVFYRAVAAVAEEGIVLDDTPVGGDEDSMSSIRTRKHFPETWLWESVQVAGYFQFPLQTIFF